jgi:hypothetical protein
MALSRWADSFGGVCERAAADQCSRSDGELEKADHTRYYFGIGSGTSALKIRDGPILPLEGTLGQSRESRAVEKGGAYRPKKAPRFAKR